MMVEYMRDIGKTVFQMVLEKLLMLMVIYMKVNSMMENDMGKEIINVSIMSILENGRKVICLAMDKFNG
jgi:hypothetical protein